jgi:hypothetical protein
MLQTAGAGLLAFNPDKMTPSQVKDAAKKDSFTHKLVNGTTMLGKFAGSSENEIQ